MNLGEWQIDDLLTFAVATHDASTGAVTDADAVPAYRIYEDETGTAILTGNMAKLDDSNTTGFYSEQITLSAANGFEVGKSYSIYISAAVDSVTGVTVYNFQVETAKATAAAVAALNDLSAAEVWSYASRTLTQSAASVTAVVTGSDITVARGTTWTIALTNIGALTNYNTVYMTVKRDENQIDTEALLKVYNHNTTGLIRFNGAVPVSVANGKITVDDIPTGDITITVQEEETVSAPIVANYHYDIKGIDDDGNVDLLSSGGRFSVTADITRSITSP